MACNVWVENGDVLIYLQRSGSLSENGEYLKMGRFRLQLDPDLLSGETEFRQELNLADGFIEIEARRKDGQKVLIKLWVDVYHPVVHLEVESNEQIEGYRFIRELAYGRQRALTHSIWKRAFYMLQSGSISRESDKSKGPYFTC